jgi:hypothetical protein
MQVNWPKLIPRPWGTEAFEEALGHARHEPVIGSFVRTHERGKSDARLGFMEEGKKRIE